LKKVNQTQAVGSALTERTLTQILDYGDLNINVNVETDVCGEARTLTSADPEREREVVKGFPQACRECEGSGHIVG